MAKRKQAIDPLAKRPDETDLQWRSRLARAEQDQRDRNEPIAPREAQRHGLYEEGLVAHAETATLAKALVNRGGTPIARWMASGKLTQGQMLAIRTCLHLWGLLSSEPRTTAGYGERLSPSTANESDRLVQLRIDARDDLRRIEGYFTGLDAWWNVFQNVVRFDEPAGVAGSKLGYGSRSAEDRAHTVVCFVADMIATKERLIPETRILVA